MGVVQQERFRSQKRSLAKTHVENRLRFVTYNCSTCPKKRKEKKERGRKNGNIQQHVSVKAHPVTISSVPVLLPASMLASGLKYSVPKAKLLYMYKLVPIRMIIT